MKNKYIKLLKNQTENNLASLKETVLGALELFMKEGLGKIKLKKFQKRVVIGSGNAIITGKIIFTGTDVLFADETNYKEILKINGIDGVTIFSASGGKHSSIIAEYILNLGLEVELVTCTKNSKTQKIIGKENVIITPKNKEAYTYNTSTYMGWILAFTKENPEKIYDFLINDLDKQLKKFDFSKYNSFLFALEEEFDIVGQLIDTKFIELFARKIARDIKTFEQLKHAVTIVPSKKELLIKFGNKEVYFENDILEIKIPENIKYAEMMAIGYYVVGFIQNANKQFFKKNIKKYINNLQKTDFGKDLKIIV